MIYKLLLLNIIIINYFACDFTSGLVTGKKTKLIIINAIKNKTFLLLPKFNSFETCTDYEFDINNEYTQVTDYKCIEDLENVKSIIPLLIDNSVIDSYGIKENKLYTVSSVYNCVDNIKFNNGILFLMSNDVRSLLLGMYDSGCELEPVPSLTWYPKTSSSSSK